MREFPPLKRSFAPFVVMVLFGAFLFWVSHQHVWAVRLFAAVGMLVVGVAVHTSMVELDRVGIRHGLRRRLLQWDEVRYLVGEGAIVHAVSRKTGAVVSIRLIQFTDTEKLTRWLAEQFEGRIHLSVGEMAHRQELWVLTVLPVLVVNAAMRVETLGRFLTVLSAILAAGVFGFLPRQLDTNICWWGVHQGGLGGEIVLQWSEVEGADLDGPIITLHGNGKRIRILAIAFRSPSALREYLRSKLASPSPSHQNEGSGQL